ncbi:hypothetical protein [Methanorbis rubei]|uniref:Uncharacterized protein n=1 Tax=Methanorbis rubei TaxID=3028300 RepID=A0AAE4SBX7_9EURY|nr:hypothetical protein [Methanocorpusculaceae archaeon Cs1]
MAFVSCDQLLKTADEPTTEEKTNGGLLKYVLLFGAGITGGFFVCFLLRRKK